MILFLKAEYEEYCRSVRRWIPTRPPPELPGKG